MEQENPLKEFRIELVVSRVANMQYFEMPAHFSTHPDIHPFCELIYIDSGEIALQSPDYEGILRKNELMIHRAGHAHSLSCGSVAPNVIIIGFECLCPRLAAFSASPVSLSETLQKMLIEIVKEGRNVFLPPYDIPNQTAMEKRQDFPFGADQLIKDMLECFLIRLIREEGNAHPVGEVRTVNDLRTGEILRYLDNNFRERITMEELCFLFGTNKTTLSKEFRRVTGTTVTEYLANLRLRHAKVLLREGGHTVTEIAELLNFSSVHYFTRFFRLHENMSPTEYAGSIRARFEEAEEK